MTNDECKFECKWHKGHMCLNKEVNSKRCMALRNPGACSFANKCEECANCTCEKQCEKIEKQKEQAGKQGRKVAEALRNKEKVLNSKALFLEEKPMNIKKYYAVRKGRKKEIVFSWDSCKKLVNGVPGAEYKSFENEEEAVAFVSQQKPTATQIKDLPYAFVDGSFNLEKKLYGFGGFLIENGKKHSLQGKGQDPDRLTMRNVAGEIEGAKAAIRLAKSLNIQKLVMYYDYMGIEKWATGEWKTNLAATAEYKEFVKNSGVEVVFFHVKGHTGIQGNEEADRLAKLSVGIRG